jgi:hypothetical protein
MLSRKPTYLALLDLVSKPFWKAHECDGVEELVEDLRGSKAPLLEEAMLLLHRFGKVKPTESARGTWTVVSVDENGERVLSETDAPVLIGILNQHEKSILRGTAFSACMISFLR